MSGTATGSWDATDRQMQFIHTLEAERGLPLTVGTLRKREASSRIDALLDMPKTSGEPLTVGEFEDKQVGATEDGEPTYRRIGRAIGVLADAGLSPVVTQALATAASEMTDEADEPFAAVGQPDKLVGKKLTLGSGVYMVVATSTGTGLATLQLLSGKAHPLVGERGRIERVIAKGLVV